MEFPRDLPDLEARGAEVPTGSGLAAESTPNELTNVLQLHGTSETAKRQRIRIFNRFHATATLQ